MGTLYFVGLGLFDVRDISVKGLETARNADSVFGEFYTSILGGSSMKDIEELLRREIRVLTREELEDEKIILDSLELGDCVLLTGGDPLSATTHQSLRMEAMKRGFTVSIIHGSSVFTAVPGLLGLPAYKFGRTTTLARPQGEYFPTSPYDVIESNLGSGLHTLILLDIKSDEQYFMDARDGIKLLMRMEDELKRGILSWDSEVAVVARAGSPEPFIWYGTLREGVNIDFGSPLHTMVIHGSCHFMEQEMLELFRRPSQG